MANMQDYDRPGVYDCTAIFRNRFGLIPYSLTIAAETKAQAVNFVMHTGIAEIRKTQVPGEKLTLRTADGTFVRPLRINEREKQLPCVVG